MKLSHFIKNAIANGHTFDQIEAVVSAMKAKTKDNLTSRDGCKPPCGENEICNGTACIDDVDGANR